MFTRYVLQHDYCCNQNCCCIYVSYLPWQPQLLCCIFGQLHNNCTCFVCIFLQTSSALLNATRNEERNWKTTIKGFQGFRRGCWRWDQDSPFWCWFKTSVLRTRQSSFWCWFKTSVPPTRLYLPPSDYSVMYCLLDNTVHCPCDNKHVSVTYATSPQQFVYCPCDNKHVSVTLVARMDDFKRI
jgi:hypothetical protein